MTASGHDRTPRRGASTGVQSRGCKPRRTLKVEFVRRHHFRTRTEARVKISTWIANFYNVKRKHSANDGLPPDTFERHMIEKKQASSALLRALRQRTVSTV
jgi:transposase InsO family protein